MVSLETPICDFGTPAHNFSLQGVDGRTWALADCRGDKGLLVMFICNHCPYVKGGTERIVRDTRELLGHGIKSVAIMSNDPETIGGLVREHGRRGRGIRLSGSPTCSTRHSRSPEPTAPFVPPTSLATMPLWSYSTVVGSTRVAKKRLRPMCAVTCSRPWCR